MAFTSGTMRSSSLHKGQWIVFIISSPYLHIWNGVFSVA